MLRGTESATTSLRRPLIGQEAQKLPDALFFPRSLTRIGFASWPPGDTHGRDAGGLAFQPRSSTSPPPAAATGASISKEPPYAPLRDEGRCIASRRDNTGRRIHASGGMRQVQPSLAVRLGGAYGDSLLGVGGRASAPFWNKPISISHGPGRPLSIALSRDDRGVSISREGECYARGDSQNEQVRRIDAVRPEGRGQTRIDLAGRRDL